MKVANKIDRRKKLTRRTFMMGSVREALANTFAELWEKQKLVI